MRKNLRSLVILKDRRANYQIDQFNRNKKKRKGEELSKNKAKRKHKLKAENISSIVKKNNKRKMKQKISSLL